MKRVIVIVLLLIFFFQYSFAYCTINDQWNKYCNYGEDCYEYFNLNGSHYYNCDWVIKYDPPSSNVETEDTIMVDEAIMVEPWYFIHRKVPKQMKTYWECYDEYWDWITVISGDCECDKWYYKIFNEDGKDYCWSYFESIFNGVSTFGRIFFFAVMVGIIWVLIDMIKKWLAKYK